MFTCLCVLETDCSHSCFIYSTQRWGTVVIMSIGRNQRRNRGGRNMGGEESRRRRESWRLLLSALWIKTNGVPRLSSQAEKHHVRFCLLLLTLWHVMTRQNLTRTHTHTHMSHSVGKHSGGNLIIVFTNTPLLKLPTCHHHGSPIYGQIRKLAEKVTLHTLISAPPLECTPPNSLSLSSLYSFLP